MNFFLWNEISRNVEVNVGEVLLVREFANLWKPERNITKEDKTGEQRTRAYRELTYIWLACDWKSPYCDYSEYEKVEKAKKDADLTEEEFNDPLFRAACRKYVELQDQNWSIKMLNAARNMVSKFVDYFNNVDPEERDELTNKPVHKVKSIMEEVAKLYDLHESLEKYKAIVQKEISQTSGNRAGEVDGFMPNLNALK